MATRERRLAEFDGNGEPPPDQPVQVLCEDHSGTYQLPFACRFIDGEWRNNESGGTVEATVVGWRLPAAHRRFGSPILSRSAPLCQNATASERILSFGTRAERIAPESAVRARTPLFTARYRLECDAAHHMQHGHDRPQPAADDKG